MKTAGVRELKARLSEYLREVKRGEVVLVTDRGEVVAQLAPPGRDAELAISREERERRQLLTSGFLAGLGTQEGEWPEPGPPLMTREEFDAYWREERDR